MGSSRVGPRLFRFRIFGVFRIFRGVVADFRELAAALPGRHHKVTVHRGSEAVSAILCVFVCVFF